MGGGQLDLGCATAATPVNEPKPLGADKEGPSKDSRGKTGGRTRMVGDVIGEEGGSEGMQFISGSCSFSTSAQRQTSAHASPRDRLHNSRTRVCPSSIQHML